MGDKCILCKEANQYAAKLCKHCYATEFIANQGPTLRNFNFSSTTKCSVKN